MRVLLVEDEADLADAVLSRLRADDLLADGAGTLAEGRRRAGETDYDLLVLDRRLPDGDGLELSRELPGVPALALTAADDDGEAPAQVTKPFATEALAERVHAMLRRGPAPPELVAGRLRIEAARRRVRRDGVIVPLTAREFDALERLLAGEDPGGEVAGLRRKLGDDAIDGLAA